MNTHTPHTDEGLLQLQQSDGQISIFYKGKKIIAHSESNPCVTLGRGRGSFRSSHANYKIKDKILTTHTLRRLSVSAEEKQHITLIDTESGARIECRTEGGELCIEVKTEGSRLSTTEDPAYNRMWLNLAAEAGEHIYGCGEQYSRLDLRGSKVPLWVEEQGVGRGKGLITTFANIHSQAGGHWYSTYYPATSFVGTEGWYCYAEASAYAEFDFTSERHYQLHFWELPIIRIGVEESFAAATAGLNRIHGIQPPLPEWTYDGMWLGVQGGGEEIEKKLEDARQAGVQVGGLWAQDWEGKRVTSFGKQLMWNWKYARDQYPNLPEQIKNLNQRGVRFLGYINPFLAIEEDLYQEASEKGYLIKNSRGEDYLIEVTTFPAALLDLTNPEAFEWIKGIIKEHMLGIGLDGWMCDYGEYLPTDAVLYSKESAETFHNRYPVEWARANREAVEEAGMLGKVVFFNRSGYNQASRYALSYWGGDQLVNWSLGDGLATAITAGMSAGFSGVGFYHSDLGGFTSLGWVKRSKELFMRWAEFAPFNQIMRSHESNRPDDCTQFNSDQEILEHLARMTKLFTMLKPYHMYVAEEYADTAMPANRHPALMYSGDETLHSLKYEYLYGADLLVAPVYKKGKKSRTAYLPKDVWIHLWSGEEYSGGYVRVDAPLGHPPVFYRKDSSFAELFARIRAEL